MARSFDRRRSRTVPVVNGAVALLVVAVLAVTALVASPPEPPSIPEFAPQSRQQIEEGPTDQPASGTGIVVVEQDIITIEAQEDGSNREVGRETVRVDAAGVPSALACATWSDGTVTQTFDPQSPPCIATWDVDAGNGGATSVGVTPSEIRLAGPAAEAAPYLEFLNSSHQFYGRRLVMVDAPACANPCTPEGQVADARRKAELGIFAALEYRGNVFSQPYHDELSRLGVISVRSVASVAPSADLASRGPHQWTFAPGVDDIFAAAGGVLCDQLVGRPARDGTEFAGQPRAFAIAVAASHAFQSIDASSLQAALAACGAGDVRVVTFNGEDSDRQLLADLRSAGISTVIVVPASHDRPAATHALLARAGSYHPEWFTLGTGDEFEASAKQLAPSDQTTNLFGLAPWNRVLGPGADPATVVLAASGAAQDPGRTFWYRSLATLAAGIQMAGPNLTPETFEAGLFRTRFPNPFAGGAPYRQASVGFNGDHVMMNDYALVWWSSTARDPLNGRAGTWCYVADGARWPAGAFPDAFGFFDVATSDC